VNCAAASGASAEALTANASIILRETLTVSRSRGFFHWPNPHKI
jgi:hypothetical protein